MKKLKYLFEEKFESINVLPGDTFSIRVKGNIVLKENINKKMTINEARMFECEIDGKEAFGGVLISNSLN